MSDEKQPPPPKPPTDPAAAAFLSMTSSQRFHAWRAKVSDQEAETQILDYVVCGGALHGFCSDNGFSYTTVLRWIRATKERGDAYDQARADRADIQAEQIIDVSRRDCSAPVLDGEGRVVGTRVDPGKVQQAKLESDNLKWVAARMKPKVWGDKVAVDHDFIPREASDEQLARKLTDVGLGPLADKLLNRQPVH
jgi:hypothetical protein